MLPQNRVSSRIAALLCAPFLITDPLHRLPRTALLSPRRRYRLRAGRTLYNQNWPPRDANENRLRKHGKKLARQHDSLAVA